MEDIKFGFGIQWHITDSCDQRCKHCYVWQNEGGQRSVNLGREECSRIVQNISDFGGKSGVEISLTITGGDPLLHPSFWQLAGMIHERGWEWTILGNATHLNLDSAERLKNLGCTRYQMSLDGKEKTHDSIRKTGSFAETIKKLGILRKAKIISLIMTTVSMDNIDEIPDVSRICVENKVGLAAFARYGGNSPNGIPPLRYKEFLSEMYETYEELKGRGTNFAYKDHLWKLFFFEKGLVKLDGDNKQIVDGCHCGFGHLSILPNGDIYACRRFDSLVGNALSESVDDVFISEKMEQYREIEDLECSKCELLLYCRGCPAVSFGEYGDWKRKDPQCWKDIQ